MDILPDCSTYLEGLGEYVNIKIRIPSDKTLQRNIPHVIEPNGEFRAVMFDDTGE